MICIHTRQFVISMHCSPHHQVLSYDIMIVKKQYLHES